MWFPPRRSVLGRIAALEVRMSDISSDQAHLNTEVDRRDEILGDEILGDEPPGFVLNGVKPANKP